MVQKFGSESGMHFQVCEKLVFSREKQNRRPAKSCEITNSTSCGEQISCKRASIEPFCQVWMSDRTSTHTLFPEQLVGANLRGGCIGFTRQKRTIDFPNLWQREVQTNSSPTFTESAQESPRQFFDSETPFQIKNLIDSHALPLFLYWVCSSTASDKQSRDKGEGPGSKKHNLSYYCG